MIFMHHFMLGDGHAEYALEQGKCVGDLCWVGNELAVHC